MEPGYPLLAGLPGPQFPRAWPLCSQGTKTLCGSIAPMDVCVRHFLQATGQWVCASRNRGYLWGNRGEVDHGSPVSTSFACPCWLGVWGFPGDGLDSGNVAKALQRAHRQGCVVAATGHSSRGDGQWNHRPWEGQGPSCYLRRAEAQPCGMGDFSGTVQRGRWGGLGESGTVGSWDRLCGGPCKAEGGERLVSFWRL